jgi:hypothetical protein
VQALLALRGQQRVEPRGSPLEATPRFIRRRAGAGLVRRDKGLPG